MSERIVASDAKRVELNVPVAKLTERLWKTKRVTPSPSPDAHHACRRCARAFIVAFGVKR